MQFATKSRVHCAETLNSTRDRRSRVTAGVAQSLLHCTHSVEDAMAAQQTGNAHYTALGTIESSAPTAALMAVLRSLRPQWHIRLVPTDAMHAPRYRVEIENDSDVFDASAIDTWLHIKSALMATFPADKPNSVIAVDP
jgi:hypothetical protein